MLRSTLSTSTRRLWRFYSGSARSVGNTPTRTPYTSWPWRSAAIIATTTAVSLWHLSRNHVHNDAAHTLPSKSSSNNSKPANSTGVGEDGVLCAVVWGSNRSNLIDPQSPGIETFQTPVNVRWLENVASRDMALHERHAACVDTRGDVYQWGDGFFGLKSDARGRAPKPTLRGKDIVKLQLTDSRVYALSASGRIYVFAANEEEQSLPKLSTSATTPWRLSGWSGREQQSIDFVEIFSKEKLSWGETFVSIAAGSNHLLALTSEGRAFAHPMNKDANSHGQLGLRKIEITASLGLTDAADRSRTTIELVPRSVADPHAKTSPSDRESVTGGLLDAINDHHIRFCSVLFEIPSLRGVKVSQIATGGRNSFVNTASGRILGWGANEYGQIGLGSGITLDTISVPTEIDLARNVPFSTKSRCLGIVAGGDLTCFVVERNTQESIYVDVLCCGNGQWGGLGNNTFSTFQGNPVRVKNISGLREFDEKEQRLLPIVPHAISVSPTGHVLLSLDTLLHAGPGGSGRDLVAWGLNYDYQLGTGKRTSLNAATTLERPEGGRFILARRKAIVKDLSQEVWKRNAEVEQCALAGYGNSVVYWKIKQA